YRDLTDRPPALPDPASGDPGDIPSVTPAGDGYELVPPPTGGGGGIGPAPWPLNTSGTTWIAPWGELNTGDRMRVTDRSHYVLPPVPRRVTVTRMAWRITPPDTNDGTLVLRFYDVAAAGGPGEPIGTEYVMSTHDDKSVGSATVTLDPGYVYIALQAVGYSGSQPEVPT